MGVGLRPLLLFLPKDACLGIGFVEFLGDPCRDPDLLGESGVMRSGCHHASLLWGFAWHYGTFPTCEQVPAQTMSVPTLLCELVPMRTPPVRVPAMYTPAGPLLLFDRTFDI